MGGSRVGPRAGSIGFSEMVVVALLLCTFVVSVVEGQAQAPLLGPAMAPVPVPAPAPAIVFPVCEGVEVLYVLQKTQEIFPNASTAEKQPYSFEALVTLTNQGYSTLESWGVGLTYKHQEVSSRHFTNRVALLRCH